MAKSLAVVVSDIHIGTAEPTVWYQPSVHEGYLATILDWVVEHAADVRELILLGDIFDFWTYAPDVRPPTLSAIVDANPAILGRGGKLASAVGALDGAVTYLLGNHDDSVTAGDMDGLRATVGPIRLGPPVHVLAGRSGRRTAFAHGHTWTMFNAPDPASPWNELPVGHFVTRAVAEQMAKALPPGQTVADVSNQGAPNGLDLRQFLRSLRLGPSVAGLLLDYVAQLAGMPGDQPIAMADGSTATLAMAKKAYAPLFRRWVAREGGILGASRAALADQYGDYLAWFAQRLALQTGAALTVFGHTHFPVGGLTVSPVDYVNSGFACPSVPDMPAKEPTFVVVDLEAATAEVCQVVADDGGGYSIRPYDARRIPPIPSPAQDYSCYVSIENRTSSALVLAGPPTVPSAGRWVVPPPPSIAPGEVGRCWVQDKLGVAGSGARCSYAGGAGSVHDFAFRCPTGVAANRAAAGDGGASFRVRVGGGPWLDHGIVPRQGHPLEVRFEVG